MARVQASEYRNVRVWLTEYGDLSDLDRSAANEWKSFSLAATHRALTALNQFAEAEMAFDQAMQSALAHQARTVLWQIHRDRGRLAQRWRRPAMYGSTASASMRPAVRCMWATW